MTLAMIGIGLTGMAPPNIQLKSRDKEEDQTEQKEDIREDKEAKEVKFG